MRTYNSINHSCTSDLSTYGDTSGMRQCFRELGLDVPDDDCYYTEDRDTAVGVIEIF